MTLSVATLAGHHKRATLVSGNQAQDGWFHTMAGQAESRGSARTFVLVDDLEPTVCLGYFSLCSHSVVPTALSTEMSKDQPRNAVPAILLARLAVSECRQGEGLGGRLLADAIRRVLAASESIGVALFVVDAENQAAAEFYEHFGFELLPGSETRLAIRIRAVRSEFES